MAPLHRPVRTLTGSEIYLMVANWPYVRIRADPEMATDEVRIESLDPRHWVSVNLATGEGVVVRPEGVEPFKVEP